MMCSDIIKKHLCCLYMTIYFYWKIVRYFKMKIFILERVLNSCKSIGLTGSQDMWFIDSLTAFVETLNSACDWFDSFEMRFYTLNLLWRSQRSLADRSNSHSLIHHAVCVWVHQEHEHDKCGLKSKASRNKSAKLGASFFQSQAYSVDNNSSLRETSRAWSGLFKRYTSRTV